MTNNVNSGRFAPLPIAVLLSLFLQIGGGVWWVSAQARDSYFLEQRVTEIEKVGVRANERASQLNERLARIEERLNAQNIILNRIEKHIFASR